MTQTELLISVIKVIPYPNQISNIDLHEPEALRFTWRGDTFRISSGGAVETVERGFLVGGNLSILLEKLMQQGKLISEITT